MGHEATYFLLIGVFGSGWLAVWWIATASRRKYLAAQAQYLVEQTEHTRQQAAALKRNAEYLAASAANSTKQIEVLERIASALEQRAKHEAEAPKA